MKNINKLTLIVLGIIIGLALGYIIFAGESEVHTDDSEDEHSQIKEDSHNEIEVVTLSEETLKEFGIILDEARSGSIESSLTLTGEIALDPIKVTHLRPRYAGVVKTIFVDLGESVMKGDTVALIESNESLVEFPLISPLSGTIISIHMSPGEIKGDHEHAIEIADLNYVWAIMTLYQKDIADVSVGQSAYVYDDLSGYNYYGKINFISPIIDESTRTTTARIELKNAKNKWKPGMFVNADLMTGKDKAELVVNVNAIQSYEGISVVFVKDKYGFRPQPVTIGRHSDKFVEILSGLHEGDIYAAEGAFTIKAELLKESFGGGHSH